MCPNVLQSKYQILYFRVLFSLVKVHKSTRQNSLDEAADLLYWTMLGATVETQTLPLVTCISTLGIVLPLEKTLASGVMVSDNYPLLHLFCTFCIYVLLSTECILHNQRITSKSKDFWQNVQWLVQCVHVLTKHLIFSSLDNREPDA